MWASIVILFPSTALLAAFAMGTLWTLQSSQPDLSLYSTLPGMAFGTSYYAIFTRGQYHSHCTHRRSVTMASSRACEGTPTKIRQPL
ncbi:hypothetical protein K474DRAFT_986392 [Panus rudis PR-1116 ss-1]|nr:hypothetical protein K474DRAFT_986392 [Panus rudis PR-1116 ss-1]